MFEKSSFYAVNKYDKDAIVCPNVNGEPVRLTREFFRSEAEFLYWKSISDEDYHLRDNADVDEERHTVPLYHEAEKIGSVIGPEEEMISKIDRIERGKASIELLQLVQTVVTPTQYRRLILYYGKGFVQQKIASIEQVGQPRVCKSLHTAIRKIKKYFLWRKKQGIK